MRLLVADEDAEAADELAEGLRMHGHAVRTAYSEMQCLKLVGEFRPDVALVFISAPELARWLRREVPVIGAGQVKRPVDLLALCR